MKQPSQQTSAVLRAARRFGTLRTPLPMTPASLRPARGWGPVTRAAAMFVPLVLPAVVLAHHGWGSYDASRPFVVTGPIETSRYENPHATITVKADKVWTVTLAPVSRMRTRGATPELVGVGKTISAYGYPSTVNPDEMRAERITVEGTTIEMR